ncbi:hypothetical protein H0H93_009337 [Arthromyces matolae]|nr:hypothetical protein H0H93_009337 [Arthromyces matolae]
MAAMNALLTLTTQVNFTTLVENAEDNEGYINGVWGSIFYDHFYTSINDGSKSLSPEVKSKGFSDFLVTRNTYTVIPTDPTRKTYTRGLDIVYEGKATGGGTWHGTLEQLIGYAKALLKKRATCFLISAIGRDVKFWRFNMNEGVDAKVEAMVIGANNVVDYLGDFNQTPNLRPQGQALSIVDHAPYIKLFLNEIV